MAQTAKLRSRLSKLNFTKSPRVARGLFALLSAGLSNIAAAKKYDSSDRQGYCGHKERTGLYTKLNPKFSDSLAAG